MKLVLAYLELLNHNSQKVVTPPKKQHSNEKQGNKHKETAIPKTILTALLRFNSQGILQAGKKTEAKITRKKQKWSLVIILNLNKYTLCFSLLYLP